MIKKISKDKSGFLEQVNKIDRLLKLIDDYILRERKWKEYGLLYDKFHNLGNTNLR